MIAQFIHLIILCCACFELAGSAAKIPITSFFIWLFISLLIVYYWLPKQTDKIINSGEIPSFNKTYNKYCLIMIVIISSLFIFVNPISFFPKSYFTNSSSLTLISIMILYLVLLRPFMFSLYEMLIPVLSEEETKEDFLRARQTVPIIFFPPILFWTILEDLGLNEGMELISEIKTLIFAPLFIFLLYIFSPKLFNWAWKTTNAKDELIQEIKELSIKADTKIAGVKIWNTFNEPLPNAAVAGLISKFRFVYITDYLLKIFSNNQIKAVVAHELGHLRLGHISTYLIFSINAILFAILAKSLLTIYCPYFYIHSSLSYVLEILFFVPIFAITFTALARHCEKQADNFSATVTTKESFISSMNSLNQMIGTKPKWFPKWLLSHPECDERIENVNNKTFIDTTDLIKTSKILRYFMLSVTLALIIAIINPVTIVFKWVNLYNATQVGNYRQVINICNSLPEWLQDHPFVEEQKVKVALNNGNYASAFITSFKAYFKLNLVSVLKIPHHSGSPEVAFDFKIVQLVLKFFNFC